ADGNDFVLKTRGHRSGVSAGSYEDFVCPQRTAGRRNLPARLSIAPVALDRVHAGVLVDLGTGFHGSMRQSDNIARGITSGAGLVHHAAEVNAGPDLPAEFVSGDDAQFVIELDLDDLGLALVVIEVFLFAGDFQMAAMGEIAIDPFLADDLLDTINGSERSCIHSPGQFRAVFR